MGTRKNLPVRDWNERIPSFTSGNRSRTAAIAVEGMTVVENNMFRDMEYGPEGKGNDITITVGDMGDPFTHIVQAPTEIYLHQEDDGEVSSMEILNNNGETTFLRLRPKF